ncbi:MAG: N-acetylmuramoyl-L-alanine amidase [Endozoicomonas sp. (ex Botrylloides leachii)]|nr:N-acetylmuramoyl-L-alanine amidase [Endozoicomonas sp. (ex Botrylloides leachii)]
MNIIRMPTPNKDNWEIPVDYLLLHYTAVDIQETLAIFMRLGGIVSAHLVIDIDGSVYELIDCLDGRTLRGRHAGPSTWQDGNKTWEKFNDFSIGIELVNYNGNIFPYSPAQYKALILIVKRLQRHYPKLNDCNRFLGHEHVAGFRGKADPGICFDWQLLFDQCFEAQKKRPVRTAVCPASLQQTLVAFKHFEPEKKQEKSAYWKGISHITESTIKLLS